MAPIYSMFTVVVCVLIDQIVGNRLLLVGSKQVMGSNSDSGADSAYFSYLEIGRTVLEVLARSIVTAVVFSVVFMQMIYAEWRTMRDMRPDIRVEHDREMGSLERYVLDPRRAVPGPAHPPPPA